MILFNIKKAPFGLLLLTAIAVLLALNFSAVVDLDTQDKTMFSLPLSATLRIIPLFLLFFWLLYVLTNRFLYSAMMTRIHVLITVSAAILIFTVAFIGIVPQQLANDRYELIGNVIQILSIVFVSGQLIYIANIVLGLLRRLKA